MIKALIRDRNATPWLSQYARAVSISSISPLRDDFPCNLSSQSTGRLQEAREWPIKHAAQSFSRLCSEVGQENASAEVQDRSWNCFWFTKFDIIKHCFVFVSGPSIVDYTMRYTTTSPQTKWRIISGHVSRKTTIQFRKLLQRLKGTGPELFTIISWARAGVIFHNSLIIVWSLNNNWFINWEDLSASNL